jgi:hypothetical protein
MLHGKFEGNTVVAYTAYLIKIFDIRIDIKIVKIDG